MSMLKIREIQQQDNQQVKKVIQDVLVEMGVPKVGTAYEDKALDDMTAEYMAERKAYFVIEKNNQIIGCCGIGPLPGFEEKICELQKMYFLPEARGRGLGAQMMDTCLKYAKSQGYKKCYIETLPYMKDACKLYKKTGFEELEKPLGNTGHYNCTVWLIKDL
ncbi:MULTISPECIES: GNAT family N-acetyltransferase [Zunongwangia]|jgi:putative acetyltransferase|uniref:GNAT family acetyltransferase n=1 Tax=Zunongwangia profunda (strain DSM 18752 / CCTCC AB 206139 / SM-A87) TaxID=655815 RepID=D5BKI8_ZUNPS|nr:GNAT family N-acetyltransferase [Zunongwangia profunda]ADF53900.1 GNAT family acetyltransferase [Zunongwangia profunda SM-A87]MAG86751.1 N-acetyltransferase [Flavobacteriaceae bacterium]MCC4230696.1 GNAT family N-acetyltransferase [Zunongwangia profunda]